MRRLLLWFGLLCWFASSVLAAEPSAQLQTSLQSFVDQGELPGVVTFIGNDAGVLDVQVLGFADLERRTPMKRDTLFRIASMTKPITAIAVMQLVEAGKVNVDEPVERYLPEFQGQLEVVSREGETLTLKKPSQPVTIRHLLTHTSGLPVYPRGLADVYQKRNRTLSETTIAISQAPLMFEPGSKWSYCNPGIDTLGRVIEVVSGLSYEEYLKRNIFEPLGMVDTTPYPTADQLTRLAMTYGKQEGRFVPMPGVLDYALGARHPVPAGGLYSTGDDLAKLYQCLLLNGTLAGRTILKPETLVEMTRNQTGELKAGFIEGSVWGFGFGLVGEPKGAAASLSPGSYGHGGAFGTQGWIDPTRKQFTILLIQRTGLSNSDGSAMRKALHDAALGFSH